MHDDHRSTARVGDARVWAEVRALVMAHRRSLGLGLVLMVVGRAAGMLLPFTAKLLVDDVLIRHRSDLLMPVAAMALGAALIQAGAAFTLAQVVGIAAQRAITDTRKRAQARLLRFPVAYFDATKTGVLLSRVMTDAEGMRNLVGTGIIQLAGGALTSLMALAVLLFVNWKLTSVVVVLLTGFGVMMTTAFRRLRPMFRERRAITADVTGRLIESIAGIRLLKIYTAEARERLVFARGVHRLLRTAARTITASSAVAAGTGVLTGLISILLITGGGRAVLAGTMTVGSLLMYAFCVGLLAAPLVQIASIGTQVSEAFAGLDRLRELTDLPTEDEHDARKDTIGHANGSGDLGGQVVFDDVTFEYRPGVPALRHVSLTAQAGATIALVGSSGSGKSTLASLVLAFHHPTTGRVLVDGRDIASVKVREYRAQVGVVMQDDFLFDGTVRENIALGKPGATEAEIRAAAHVAHCDEFVDRFAEGYGTVIGERGVRLSGGQRQRVAIARAIVADPRILILDEATSSLDTDSEALIRDGLRSLRRGRTTFVIAHRLSTIEGADQIVVLERGEIVERGTHRELLARNGRYRQLHERQHSAEIDQFINPGEDFLVVAPNDEVRTI